MFKQLLFLSLSMFLLLQAACTPAAPEILATPTAMANPPEYPAVETPAPTSPSVVDTAPAGGCPTPAAEQNLLMNQEDGYCLLYPAEYTRNGQLIIINPAPGPGDIPGEAWMSIYMEEAKDRTSAQAADEQINAFGLENFEIVRADLEVGGEPGVVVDGLPGQDSSRRVFVVHGDRLYIFTFMPWMPNTGNDGQPTPLEGLYEMVLQSTRFLFPTKPLPTPTMPWGPGNLPPLLTFEFPQDGQVIDYNSNYSFKVTDIGADGYLWSFSQNGQVIWENLRDEMGLTAGGTYTIPLGSEAHGRFMPGPVEVSVRAQKGDYLAEPTTITIVLQ